MKASLYLHIPFCAGACDYCDFYSIPVDPHDRRIGVYADTLLRDGERFIRDFGVSCIPTVYIGGGTPSMLGASGIRRLLSGLAGLWRAKPEEITVEANPESAEEAFLLACREGGVTRISLGVQSFHGPSRQAVHRVGTEKVLAERLGLVSAIFGRAFSVDLIAGLPFQDERILLGDIERVLAYKPDHISLYALTLEPGTPLEQRISHNKTPLPDPDTADDLWIAGRDALEQAGYGQYEVSNFALNGKRAAHNIRYWRMENWLGLGTAASSTIVDDETGTGRRITIKPDMDAYIRGSLSPIVEELGRLTLMKETFLMGFRYIEGPDEKLFQRRFGLPIRACIPHTLAVWQDRGLLQAGKPALTAQGILFLDPFLLDVFEEAPASLNIKDYR
ncbi:MAG: radical SAM family heme chaperone HemW [Treponema sp.]|jgi:oxygen-independent coproporphyrinogen-3 oxidase|nr:radical SAM family heme chaperone HemW [Treponema sp.]